MQNENENEILPHVHAGLNAESTGSIIFKLASYTNRSLQAQLDLTTKSLGMAAAAIDMSNDHDLRRWNRLAKLATEVVDARLALVAAMVQWSDVSECEEENSCRESRMLAAMDEYDEVSKVFNIFGQHF